MLPYRNSYLQYNLSLAPRLVIFWIVLTSSNGLQQPQSNDSSCKLRCPSGISCITGQVNHLAQFFENGTQISLSSDTNTNTNTKWDGEHCNCPAGLTGLLCEVPYETCADGQHTCYNNGTCIPGQTDYFGNEQMFCDCTNAIDHQQSIRYVGKYCEHAVTILSDEIDNSGTSTITNTTASDSGATAGEKSCTDAPDQFCLNDGQCNTQYPTHGGPCSCKTGYSGLRCEYKDGTVPNCTLPCAHGQCVLGKIERYYYAPFWKDVVIDTSNDGTNDLDYMHCNCPDNYDGPLCNIEREQCGTSTDGNGTEIIDYCYFGSRCVSNKCDCSEINSYNVKYTGEFCQFKSEVFCDSDHTVSCVNGGTCNTTNPLSGCTCPQGFEGLYCEKVSKATASDDTDTFVTPDKPNTNTSSSSVITEGNNFQDTYVPSYKANKTSTNTTIICDLQCVHGTCKSGSKQVATQLSQIVENTQHLFEDTTDASYKHCDCDDSWTGPLCDVPVETCPDGQHMCLHGTKCVSNDDKQQSCDCNEVDSEMATFYAGSHCEHKVNDICTKNANPLHGLPLSFCVNGGVCKDRVNAGQPHPGCSCQEGFIGPHCELRESVHVRNSDLPRTWNPNSTLFDDRGDGSHQLSTTTKIICSLLILVIVGIVLAFTFSYYRRTKSRKQSKSINWAEKYRDHQDESEDENIAPRRDSTFEYTFSRNNKASAGTQSSYASSRDPIAARLAPSMVRSASAVSKSRLPVDDGTLITASETTDEDHYMKEFTNSKRDGILFDKKTKQRLNNTYDEGPKIYIGPPRDEDGHVLHNVEIA